MWRTSQGERVLTPAEFAIFAVGADLIRRQAEEAINDPNADQEGEAGVDVFDRLTPEQRIGIVAQTLDALADPMCPCPPLVCVSEASVAAMLSTFESFVLNEIVYSSATHGRGLLVALCKEQRKVYGRGPRITSRRRMSWEVLIEVLHDQVLWDADYDMDDLFGDMGHEESEVAHEELTITTGYYSAAAPEPNRKDLELSLQKLRALCGEVSGLSI